MEKVLIDLFTVPQASLPEFIAAASSTMPFLRAQPGFVEGHLCQARDGSGRYNVVTTAVWADEAAFENAKRAAQQEYQRIGFSPPEIIKRLGVTMERGVFDRTPY